jgi:uncharacterized protein Usg
MSSLMRQLQGHRLTTAEIIYRLPDHPQLLQSYIWQELDTAPRFPVLRKFLQFWDDNLDGALHLVRVATTPIVQPAEFRFIHGDLVVH